MADGSSRGGEEKQETREEKKGERESDEVGRGGVGIPVGRIRGRRDGVVVVDAFAALHVDDDYVDVVNGGGIDGGGDVRGR